MPNILNTTILNEGTQKAVIHFYMESDGNEGEWIQKTLFDPSNDFNQLPDSIRQRNPVTGVLAPPKLSILQLWSSASWFDMTLGFNGLVPVQVLPVARDASFYMDFRYFGGLADFTPMENLSDGKLLITTRDFAPLGSNGFLILEVRRN